MRWRGGGVVEGEGRGCKNVQHPKSNIQSPTSKVQHPKSNIQSPTSKVQHPKLNIQSPTSKVQRPKSKIQSPTSETAVPPHPTISSEVSVSRCLIFARAPRGL